MNALPIPALDGGHVMFLLYEVLQALSQMISLWSMLRLQDSFY